MELVCMSPFYIVPAFYRPHVFHYQRRLSYNEEYYCQYRVLMFQRAKCYQNVPREIKSRWMSPGPERFKLNTDGSSRGNPGPSSFGGLIRKGEGEWVCGYTGRINGKSCTSLEAEVRGIYYGLCLIRDKNYSNVLIETDSEAALKMLRGEVEKDHTLKSVLDDIMTIIIQQKCGMCFTRRDGNHCADQLAKLGGSQFKEYIELKEPPTLLLPYLERDKQAALEFQKMNKPRG